MSDNQHFQLEEAQLYEKEQGRDPWAEMQATMNKDHTDEKGKQ